MKNEEMLEKGSLGKLFVKLCIPTIVIMLVLVIYNMADIYFIGQTGDTNQVAAIALSGPIFSVLQGIGTLLGGGGSIALSMALGKREEKRIRNITSFCCYSSLVIGAIVTVVILLFCNPLIKALGATGDIMKYAGTYIRIMAIGAPAVLFANVFANIVRSDGSAKESMIGNGLGTLTNIALDPLFILGLNMGVAGAAIATVLGNLVSCIYLIAHVVKKQKKLSLSIGDFTLKKRVPFQVLTLGIPLATSTILMSFAGMFSNKLLVGYGDIVIAANGVSSKVGMLIGMIAMGICMGIQPAIAYNYGAGNLKRMGAILKRTAVVTVAIGTILTAICFTFRNQIVAFFIDDKTLISYGQFMVIGGLVTGPVFGLYQLCTSFLQATGKVSYATLVSVLRQGIIYIPVIILMNTLFGLNGMIFSGAISDVISLLIAGVLSRRWFKEIRMERKCSGAISLE